MITRVPTIDQSDMEFVYEDQRPERGKCLKRSARVTEEREESCQEDLLQDYLAKVGNLPTPQL